MRDAQAVGGQEAKVAIVEVGWGMEGLAEGTVVVREMAGTETVEENSVAGTAAKLAKVDIQAWGMQEVMVAIARRGSDPSTLHREIAHCHHRSQRK